MKPRISDVLLSSVLFLALLGLIVGQGIIAADGSKASRPNVVLIISDDHAWTDYGFAAHPHAKTPNIDRLVNEGLTYTRGYVTTAICSPSLATMLTGLHPHQHGITGNDPVRGQKRADWVEAFLKKPLLPKLLSEAGYLTLHTGKFWMGEPGRAGFTDDMGSTGRHGGKALSIGRKSMKPIYDFMDKAKHEDKPFFVWYAPFLPHTPHNPPARLLDKYAEVKNAKYAKYLAMIEWLDETCGELMGQLKIKGVADDTLVIYLADNGWNEYGKASPYENGVRTPVIAHWPGKVRPRKDERGLVTNIDVAPTILTACGVTPPSSMPGINLLDDKAVTKRDTLFLSNFAHNMVSATEPEKSLWTRSCIHGKWKLLFWIENPPKQVPWNRGHRHKNPGVNLELFDLLADPHETKNLAKEHPEIVQDLSARIDGWWKVD